MDDVGRQVLEPGSFILPYADETILDDEVVVLGSSSPTTKLEVFEPGGWVGVSSVLGNVAWETETLRERRILYIASECPGS